MFKFGIDWSENHHNLCIRNDKGAVVSQLEFKHTLDGFQRFDDGGVKPEISAKRAAPRVRSGKASPRARA